VTRFRVFALVLVVLLFAAGVAWATAPNPDHVESFTEAVERGYIEGDPAYYYNGEASPQEYAHAVMVALAYFEDNIINQGTSPSTTTTTTDPATTTSSSTTTTEPTTTTTSSSSTTTSTTTLPTGSETPFLAYPASDPIVIDGGTDIELSELSITEGTIAVTIRNVDGAYIHDIDFENVVGGIYVYNSTDVVIENVRGRNVGDGTIGSGHSNYVQFAESVGGAVRNSVFIGGDTEDMISTWHSGGIVIENNYLENDDWSSASGTGIILSDGEGSPNNGNITVRNNVLINPGQVGIQCIDGPNLKVYGNVVYGEARPLSNQPFSSWEGRPEAEVYGNTHRWYKPDGTQTSSWFHVPVDFHDNTYDPNLNPDEYRKEL
jgi:hypothetical protein